MRALALGEYLLSREIPPETVELLNQLRQIVAEREANRYAMSLVAPNGLPAYPVIPESTASTAEFCRGALVITVSLAAKTLLAWARRLQEHSSDSFTASPVLLEEAEFTLRLREFVTDLALMCDAAGVLAAVERHEAICIQLAIASEEYAARGVSGMLSEVDT
jgi:hypothetical protein